MQRVWGMALVGSCIYCIYTHSNILETHAHDEVGRPVGTAGHRHGCRPWTLGEELRHKEPGDGARTHLKERHKPKDGQHADVAHPWDAVLFRWKEEHTLSESLGEKTVKKH